MATQGWRTDHALDQALFETGWLFEFYQAVRLLETRYPDRVPVGEGSMPERETVRFKSNVDLQFPASEISAVVRSDRPGMPDTMHVNVMGLAGVLGPMPVPYTELILERKNRKDTALRDFLDIFNHRFVSLLYRTRKYFRIAFPFESPDQSYFTRALYALMGIGTAGLRNRMAMADRSLLYYTGLFSQQPRSMAGLEVIISHYFKVACHGKQLKGRWWPIAKDQLTRIGKSGQNQTLGKGTLMGTQVWIQQSRFQLRLGPLSFTQFLDFLPTRTAYEPLCQMVRFYAGREFEFDFRFAVKAGTIPPSRLEARVGLRLGWSAWIKRGGDDKPGDAVKPDGIVWLDPRRIADLLRAAPQHGR